MKRKAKPAIRKDKKTCNRNSFKKTRSKIYIKEFLMKNTVLIRHWKAVGKSDSLTVIRNGANFQAGKRNSFVGGKLKWKNGKRFKKVLLPDQKTKSEGIREKVRAEQSGRSLNGLCNKHELGWSFIA